MNTSTDDPKRRASRVRAVDAGLLGGLLLALIAVQVVDRLGSARGPGQVDLVFLLDQGWEMRGFLDGMKARCLEKAEGLRAAGVDCRFAVIPFGPGRKRVATVPLVDDVEAFRKRLMAEPARGETPKAATGVAALEEALALDFRKDTPVLFFLISRAPCPEGADVAAVAARMVGRKVTTIVQADAAEKDRCRPLYQAGGRFFSMEGADLTGPVAETSKSDKPDPSKTEAGNLLARLAPDTRSFNSSDAVKLGGLYSARNAPNRQQLVIQRGGSQDSERAVADGLAWLARHQGDDGSWSDPEKCEQGRPCPALNYRRNAAIAETGLAILAFQAGGNYAFNEQKYSANVRRGLDWLVAHQKQDGCLFGEAATWYEHGIGSFALAEACAVALAEDEDPDPRYLDAARRAIQFIETHQYPGGGWRYTLESGQGDTSVSGWQVLALKSAQEARIDVAADTIRRVQEFYESLGDPETGLTGYVHRGTGTDLTTAVGLIVQEFILKKPDSPLARKSVSLLRGKATDLGRTGDFYTVYNGTLALFLARGDAWKQWNRGVRDAVVKRQIKDGCTRGSWTDHYGRTLGTSWAVLTLEIYYRYATEEAEATPKALAAGK